MTIYFCEICEEQVVPKLLTEKKERYVVYKVTAHGAMREELILCDRCQQLIKNWMTDMKRTFIAQLIKKAEGTS